MTDGDWQEQEDMRAMRKEYATFYREHLQLMSTTPGIRMHIDNLVESLGKAYELQFRAQLLQYNGQPLSKLPSQEISDLIMALTPFRDISSHVDIVVYRLRHLYEKTTGISYLPDSLPHPFGER